MIIDNKFKIGQYVYLLTDDEQKKRMITAIRIYTNSYLEYQVTCGTFATDHMEMELSDTEDVSIKI